MKQKAGELSDQFDGFLKNKKYLIIDRRLMDGMNFEALLAAAIAAILLLFLGRQRNIGLLIRRLFKLTQAIGSCEIQLVFLKFLLLSVRQKVRQFAVDTQLITTCYSLVNRL